MSRWSAADLARVASRGVAQIADSRTCKYGNTPTVIDGIRFDSKLEAKRYGELKLLKMTGVIHDLKVHQQWHLHANGIRLGYYESDFNYVENGQPAIEDCKGVATALYIWKKKHVYAEYGIHIREIKA